MAKRSQERGLTAVDLSLSLDLAEVGHILIDILVVA
jgi:hypothetical protein